MTKYIEFYEHHVKSPEGVVFFSPPYLMERKTYEAVFAVLADLNLAVLECKRKDLEMTRDTNGMEQVAEAMTEKLLTLNDRLVLDVGMSLGAGFTALARQKSETTPVGRLILSPAPDPVTPWNKERFQSLLNKANNGEVFVSGVENYVILEAIKKANEELSTGIKTHIIAETTRGINDLSLIKAWAEKIKATLATCLYVHGTFRNKGDLPLLVKVALEEFKGRG